MKLRDVYWFLQPTIAVLIGFGAVLTLRYELVAPNASRGALDATLERRLSKTLGSLELPRPALTPDRVVRIQMAALASVDRPDGALQCFCFASPANRAVTGPLERFARYVRVPPYDALSEPEAATIGKTTLIDGTARVLVTVVSDQQVQAFVWILSKQYAPPWHECWMTDAVFPLQTPVGQPYASSALPEAS